MLDKQPTNWVTSISHSPYLNLETVGYRHHLRIRRAPTSQFNLDSFMLVHVLSNCMLVGCWWIRYQDGLPKGQILRCGGRVHWEGFFSLLDSLTVLPFLVAESLELDFFVCWGSASLSSSGWHWTCGSPPATASWVLGSLTCVHSRRSRLERLQNGVQVILSSINPASNLKSELFPGCLRWSDIHGS